VGRRAAGPTIAARKEDMIHERAWYVMDAADKPLGRLAVDVAKVLRGKHKPIFTPHVDTGDYVIVINAAKVAMTGASKAREPVSHHSGWPGGLKQVQRSKELDRFPSKAIERVVRGMVPHNRLGDAVIRKLKVYDGPEHPHRAQRPIPYTDGVQARIIKEPNMPQLVVKFQDQPERCCTHLAAILLKPRTKYFAGSIFPDHFALWWTTRLETVERFLPVVHDYLKVLQIDTGLTNRHAKLFSGVYLYAQGNDSPIHLPLKVEQSAKLSERDVEKYTDGKPQMIRLASEWGDFTYDFVPFNQLPRRITVTSHVYNAPALARLVQATNANEISVGAVERGIREALEQFRPLQQSDWEDID
jgi:large subunit ribosomal protein L13